MKGFARLATVLLAAMFAVTSCSKSEDLGSIGFNTPALYFSMPSTEQKVSYWSQDIQTVSVTARPAGWPQPVVDPVTQTITITAPAAYDTAEDGTKIALSGTITLIGMPTQGSPKAAVIFVALVPTIDKSAEVANSYLVTQRNTHYTFDGTLKGDGTTRIAPASASLIWQSAAALVQYVQLDKDGRVSFYVGSNEDETKIKEGNALIGAYDKDGGLLWSWHVWAADYDPAAKALSYANGFTMMDRNLGAINNANTTAAEKVASYGLYYQWGRKDPFAGPVTYQFASGNEMPMYNNGGTRIYTSLVDANAETGTMAYAQKNPLNFIKGNKGSKYDWLWSDHATTLWSETAKTINDPCPYGWRVAPAGAFSGLMLDGHPTAADYDNYAWKLTDGTVSSLYMAAGRRSYLLGKLVNTYDPQPMPNDERLLTRAEEAQPWVGYYWTSKTPSAEWAQAMTFWYVRKDPTASGIQTDMQFQRANGMSVRCVKIAQ